MSSVALIRCEGYESPEIRAAVSRAVERVGGISRFVRPGDRVLLKPNLLCGRVPEQRVTTDPEVVRAVAEMVIDAGARPFIGDSPAIEPFKRVAAKSGMTEIADELGIPCVELTGPTRVELREKGLFRGIEIAHQVLEADVVVNLPKLKTHCQMLLTLGVKNMFGTIVAQRKAEWHHMAGVDRDTFARLLLEVYLAVRPSLTVLDGVWGMEGHGPSNGRPRKLGLVAASEDAVALDMAICLVLGLPLRSFPLYRAARVHGDGEWSPERISFVGDPVEDFAVHDFDAPALDSLRFIPAILDGFTKRYLVSKPVQARGLCAACGQCVEICPVKAVELGEGRIFFDYVTCIRCYCCQEVCPKNAIHFERGLLVKALNWLNR